MVAAALLGEEATGSESARLLGGPWQLSAPAHWKAELANVLWKAVRQRRARPQDVEELLDVAQALPIASVDVAELWRGALARALEAGHPVYDTSFVELAARLGTKVASYDGPLAARFPEHVQHPADLLSRR